MSQETPKLGKELPEIRGPQPPEFASFEEERRHYKHKAIAAFRLFGRLGFDEGAMGHISFRDPEFPDTFWLNAFAVGFDVINVRDLLRVDFKGRIIEGEGFLHPGGFPLHSAILETNPDARSAVHTHAVHSRAWSALGRLIDPLSSESAGFYGRHALFDTFADGEGQKLAALLGRNKALILKNHGIVTIGQSVDEAAYWFLALEKVCQAQLLAEAAGQTSKLPTEIAEKLASIFGSYFGWLNFQPHYQNIIKAYPELLDDLLAP